MWPLDGGYGGMVIRHRKKMGKAKEVMDLSKQENGEK